MAKSISVNEHLEEIILYTHAKMLSPVPGCKYFQIPTTITRLTDFQVYTDRRTVSGLLATFSEHFDSAIKSISCIFAVK